MTIEDMIYKAEHELLCNVEMYTEDAEDAKANLNYIGGVLDMTRAVIETLSGEMKKIRLDSLND